MVPNLAATALQVVLEKVSEVGEVATQVSPSQLNTASPAMIFVAWGTGCASLATTGSAAKAGAADRVAAAAQAAARVRSFMMSPPVRGVAAPLLKAPARFTAWDRSGYPHPRRTTN